MSILAFALLLTAAPEGASLAVMETLEPAFKGVITSTYKDGRQGKLNLSRDGTYRYRGRTNKASSGVWDVKDDSTICLHQKKPIGIGKYCTPIPNGKTWRAKAVGGEMVTLRVVGAKG